MEKSENFGEISEKVGEISEIIGKNRKKSGKIGQKKFLCIFLFEAHRKTIFRRNIGRKTEIFVHAFYWIHDIPILSLYIYIYIYTSTLSIICKSFS